MPVIIISSQKKENVLMNIKGVAVLYFLGFLSVVAGFVADDFTYPQYHSAFSPLSITLYLLGAILFALGAFFIAKMRNKNHVN
jgi:hypothetical protein